MPASSQTIIPTVLTGNIRARGSAALDDAALSARAEQLICPATGLTVAESWAAECAHLTSLPEILPEPFDDVGVRRVGIDGLVAFEGRQCSVPFADVGERVEVRGCTARCRCSRIAG